MRPIASVAFILGLLAAWPAQAQNAPPTLAAALEMAWQRTPQAQSRVTREAGLRAAKDAASTVFPGSPVVGLAHSSDRFDRNVGERELEAEISAPLWLPGQKAAARRAAGANSAVFAAEQGVLRLQLAGQLREALWDIRQAENAAALARARQQAVSAIEADVARRVKAGDLARSDWLLAQNDVAAAQEAVVEAERLLLAARKAWTQLVGAVELPVQDAETANETAELEAHPALAASRERIAAAQAQAQLVRKSGRDNPELSVIARRERGEAAEPYGNSIGVAIRFPLGSAPRQATRTAEAEAVLTEAEVAHQRLLFSLQQEVETAAADMRAAAERAELARARHMLAAENLELTRKAFALGEKSLFELQRVQDAFHEAALAAGQAAIELNRSRARLNQARGVLP